MRILYIIYRFYPSIGGSQNHVLALSREMQKRGHEVTVVTTKSLTNTDVRGISTGRNFSLKSTFQENLSGLGREQLKIIRFSPLFQIWTYLFCPQLFLYLLKNIHKFDIVHAHCYQTSEPDIVNIVSFLRNRPFILTAHDIVTPFGGTGRLIKKIYDQTMGRLLLKRAKFLIALTNENKKQYLNLGKYDKKIVVINNGVDYNKIADRKIERHKNTKYQILFVGRLLKYKGAQHIIASIPEIVKYVRDINFVFVGEDYGYKSELLKLVEKIKVGEYCKFAGKVSEQELIDFYRTSEIFILPSCGEGFGLVALEAISGGAYPILARSGGLTHILKDIGGVAVNLDRNVPQQISAAVIQILNNIESKKSEVRKMQGVIRNAYSWGVVAEKTEKVYLQVK